MTESCDPVIYSQVVRDSNSNSSDYMNFIRYVTPEIIEDFNDRGWIENARNKVIVRYIANRKWQSLTSDEQKRWNKGPHFL